MNTKDEAVIAHTNPSIRTLLLEVMLARSIGRVVIGVERKQPQPGAIAPGHSSAAAADPQAQASDFSMASRLA